MTLPRSLAASYSQRTGAAAEAAFAAELTRLGATVYRPAANSSARWNRDAFGFDIVAMTGSDVLLVQVKATATDPWPPAPIWRARFLALPHPPSVRYLLAWLRPGSAGWTVWRLLSDGTRLACEWPPMKGNP
jgi:hypothetical protein